jgi:hypothetical protein
LKRTKLGDWPTAWSELVCDCGECEGCLAVHEYQVAFRRSAEEIKIEVEKKLAEKLNEAFNNS